MWKDSLPFEVGLRGYRLNRLDELVVVLRSALDVETAEVFVRYKILRGLELLLFVLRTFSYVLG